MAQPGTSAVLSAGPGRATDESVKALDQSDDPDARAGRIARPGTSRAGRSQPGACPAQLKVIDQAKAELDQRIRAGVTSPADDEAFVRWARRKVEALSRPGPTRRP